MLSFWSTKFKMVSQVLDRIRPKTRRQKTLVSVFVFVFVGSLLLAPEPVFAQLTTIGNGLIYGFTYIMLALARFFMSISIFFLQFFIEIAKYNNFIDAPPVVIGWLMVRDVANMFFVVILLIIAFATILGLEQYEWKKTLIKLVLAAIFINFSKLILQLVIDIAHVFTTTFLNAIVATAGGNLINMFKMDRILQMSAQDLNFVGPGANSGEEFRLDLFIAGIMAVGFAIMIAIIIGYYMLLMLIRMLVLWILIILSPIAFIAQVLPATKGYADEFWKEFLHHVMVAPMAVFFLWLAFATLGSGNISGDINLQLSAASQAGTGAAQTLNLPSNPSVSLSEAGTWENFASFLIALGFLYVGIDRIQKLGVQGGSLAGSALSFGKKVATIATGYAAGRYAYEKLTDTGKGLVKGAAYHAPFIGGERWEQRFKTQVAAWKGAYFQAGQDLTDEGEHLRVAAEAKQTALNVAEGTQDASALSDRRVQMENERADLLTKQERAKKEGDTATVAEAQRFIDNLDRDIKSVQEAEGMVGDIKAGRVKREDVAGEIKALEKGMTKELKSKFIGRIAQRGIQVEKQMAKTEKDAETRKKLLWKRTGSEAGGFGRFGLGGIGTKGILNTGILGDKYNNGKLFDAMDRIYRGQLAGEEARSAAKDREYETKGKLQVLGRSRLKLNVKTQELKYEVGKGTMAERVFEHDKIGGQHYENIIKRLEDEAKRRVLRKHDEQGKGNEEIKKLHDEAFGLGEEIQNLNANDEDRNKELEELGLNESTLEKMAEISDEQKKAEIESIKNSKDNELERIMASDKTDEEKEREKERIERERAVESRPFTLSAEQRAADLVAIENRREEIAKEKRANQEKREGLEKQLSDKKIAIAGARKRVFTTPSGISYDDFVDLQSINKIVGAEVEEMDKKNLSERFGEKLHTGLLTDAAASELESGKYESEAVRKSISKAVADKKKAQAEVEKEMGEIYKLQEEIAKKKEPDSAEIRDIDTEIKNKGEEIKEMLDEREKHLKVLSDKKAEKTAKAQAESKVKEISESIKGIYENIETLRENRDDLVDTFEMDEATENEVARLEGVLVEKKKTAANLKKNSATASDNLETAKGDLGELAQKLRDGDITVAEKMVKDLESQGREVEAENWKKVVKNMKSGGSLAWSYGTQKSRAVEADKMERYRHNLLLSESEQRDLWDGRGVNTPKSTLSELIEEQEKNYREMSYNDFVSSVGGMFASYMKKVENDEVITDGDRAALAGLFKRGFDSAWVDDAIIGIWENKESREMVARKLGWTNMDFSLDKIRDVEMLFAHAGDANFVSENAVMSEFLDEVNNSKGGRLEKEYKMNTSTLIKAIETDNWIDSEGNEMTKEKVTAFKKELEAGVMKHMAKQKRNFTDDQQKLMGDLLGRTGITADRKKFIDKYMKKTRDNQSALQFFGNLRDQAITGGHGENAGWALSHDVDGEQLYLGSGVRMARNHVMGDLNKTDVRLRAKSHPHILADMREEFGQIATRIREDDYALVRNGIIDMRSHTGTTSRVLKILMGLSASDESHKMMVNGRFLVGKSDNAIESWGRAHRIEFEDAEAKAREINAGKSAEEIEKAVLKAKQALAAKYTVENIYFPQMKINQKDFILTAAANSELSQPNALSSGEMNLTIPYIKSDGSVAEKTINSFDELTDFMKSGLLGQDVAREAKELGKYVKSETKKSEADELVAKEIY